MSGYREWRPVGVWILAMTLLAAGCAPQPTGAEKWLMPKPRAKGGAGSAGKSKPAPGSSAGASVAPTNAAEATYPQVVRVIQTEGRVYWLNPEARFVIIDFAYNPLPQPEQRLGVYRGGQRIGTVRVTGAPRGGFMAADILEGEAQPPDEIRPD